MKADLEKILEFIASYRPGHSNEYALFFKDPKSLPEDKRASIQADLAASLEEIASKEPGFAQCMKDALLKSEKTAQPGLLSADHPDVTRYGKKFMSGGIHTDKDCEQAISTKIYGRIYDSIQAELCRNSSSDWQHDTNTPLNDLVIKNFEKIKIEICNHALVYHPYAIISKDESKIRDLSTGLTYAVPADDPVLAANNNKDFDKKPLPGSYVKMPVLDDDGLFFYPKEMFGFNARLTDSLEISFNRIIKPISKEKIVKRITSSEQWAGSLDNFIIADAELHPAGVSIFPKTAVNLSFDFKSGKILGLDKEADFAPYIVGGMCLGTVGGMVLSAAVATSISPNAIYSAPIMSLGVFVSLASGVISTLLGCLYYQNGVVKPEEEQSKEVMKSQWQSTSTRIFR